MKTKHLVVILPLHAHIHELRRKPVDRREPRLVARPVWLRNRVVIKSQPAEVYHRSTKPVARRDFGLLVQTVEGALLSGEARR